MGICKLEKNMRCQDCFFIKISEILYHKHYFLGLNSYCFYSLIFLFLTIANLEKHCVDVVQYITTKSIQQ